ncbi:MAG: glycoside hydrolase family 2, partial [Clostridia bacterium]|nr:glycoside hydrolase family 2 [Clostridia bacterium]
MVTKTMFPLQDFARSEWLNLNGTWDFSFDEPTYDTVIEVPYPWGSPLSGIAESKDGTGFYRRSVQWNPKGEKIFLCFGAVDYTCEVAVNGKALGGHKGGYAKFEFDVTDVWNREGDNEITVSATDTGARNQTYGKQGY